MKPSQVDQLVEAGLVLFATIVATALLVVVGVWAWRTYQASEHRRLSRQRRREATRIQLAGKKGPRESETERPRRRRSRRSRRQSHFTIDLVRKPEPAPDRAEAAAPPTEPAGLADHAAAMPAESGAAPEGRQETH